MNRYIFALIILCTVSPLTFAAQPNLPAPQGEGFQNPPFPVAPHIIPQDIKLIRKANIVARRAAQQPHQFTNPNVIRNIYAPVQPASSPMDESD